MDFFCFSTSNLFFHFIAFGLRPWGSGFDGSFFVFRLAASFCIFLEFGLRPSSLGFHGFFFSST